MSSATYDVVIRNKRRQNHERPHSRKRDHAWWPGPLDLSVLSGGLTAAEEREYRDAFDGLDLAAVQRDVEALLTTSQPWWPADFGHYGPLMIRLAWHSAGSYRVRDGRGGARAGLLRFPPVASWPDNRSLDKARRLLWPVKQRYGRALSWADLMVFAGTVALEVMGLPVLGFAGGRADVPAPEAVDWGPERAWLADERHTGVRRLDPRLAASAMGLVYVDPEGPRGVPDPFLAGRDIRQTHGRMGFDDAETVALIAGGHTFGKTHGAAPETHLGPEPDAAPPTEQGLGWRNAFGTGVGPDAITSGLDGIWTPTPTRWDNSFLETLYGYDWDAVLSPAGRWQWIPSDGGGAGTVPDAHDPSTRHVPTVLTTDLALRFDPGYAPVSRRYLEHPDELADAFARAWFKLTHVDLGPRPCYRGPRVPAVTMGWQDPVPARDHELVGPVEVADLKRRVLDSGLPVSRLVATAWASASTYRRTDRRGGADGARIRLAPQRGWAVNDPRGLAEVLAVLEGIREGFPGRISLADLIVLAGCAGVERAAAAAGHAVTVPFRPGRTDATQEQTDVAWFAALEPAADGFRNWGPPSEHLLVDRASLLGLSPHQMTVLVGGLRALGVTTRGLGLLTTRPGALTTDFFVNLLDIGTCWTPTPAGTVIGRDRATGEHRWTASRVDLVLGTDARLRAIAEGYASADAEPAFVRDFVAAWAAVMDLGRFDPPDER